MGSDYAAFLKRYATVCTAILALLLYIAIGIPEPVFTRNLVVDRFVNEELRINNPRIVSSDRQYTIYSGGYLKGYIRTSWNGRFYSVYYIEAVSLEMKRTAVRMIAETLWKGTIDVRGLEEPYHIYVDDVHCANAMDVYVDYKECCATIVDIDANTYVITL